MEWGQWEVNTEAPTFNTSEVFTSLFSNRKQLLAPAKQPLTIPLHHPPQHMPCRPKHLSSAHFQPTVATLTLLK